MAALAAVGSAQAPPDPIPKHETFTIESRAVGERRTINVYTPPGYAGAARARFPVLYMLDGGLDEDFPHVVNTIDSLIAIKVIPPTFVVGIVNTERRRDTTGPTTLKSDSAIAPHIGGSAAFRSFIRDELMPEVRTRYRCTEQTSIVGESLAGLFILETFLLEPALFRRYIAFSPSLWWNGNHLLRTAEGPLPALAAQERTLYLSPAVEEIEAGATDTLVATLKARALRRVTLVYEPRPDLKHSTIFYMAGPGAFAKVLGPFPHGR